MNGVDHPEDPDLFCSSLSRASSPGDLQFGFSEDLALALRNKLDRTLNCEAWNQQLGRTLTVQHKNSGHNTKETL